MIKICSLFTVNIVKNIQNKYFTNLGSGIDNSWILTVSGDNFSINIQYEMKDTETHMYLAL